MTQKNFFKQPLTDLVKKRFSCRSFDGRGLETEMLAALAKLPAGLELPFGNVVRFGVIDRETVRAENLFSKGSYGMIKGVRYYLSALLKKGAQRGWEDVGFGLEALVLQATSLELGSCWIGGVFDRRNFGRALNIGADEILPAVIAVGRPAEKRSWRDRIVRWSARGDLRREAGAVFFSTDWRTSLSYADLPPWGPVLENVRLGPSASNKQPWRLVYREGAFHFFLSRDKAYSAMMPYADLQRIDMGIAMCHFQLSASEAGLDGKWQDANPHILNTPVNFEYIVSFACR